MTTPDMYNLMMATIIMPIIISSISKMIDQIIDLIKKIFNWVMIKLVGDYNLVEIKRTSFCSGRGMFDFSGQDRNDTLITSVLYHLDKNHILASHTAYNLGKSTRNINSTAFDYERCRIFEAQPITCVIYKDFQIIFNHDVEQSDKSSTVIKKLTIKSKKPTKNIENFIKMCYCEFIKEIYDNVHETYMFKHTISKGDPLFKKYILNNKLIFDDIFFQKKQTLMRSIERFQAGKFSKLSLLLYGEPGCGKTSIIKAMANKLQYHVIEVKLAFVLNDFQLVDIFNNPSILHEYSKNENKIENIPLNRRIYVFEDIDAECDTVHNRDDTLNADDKIMDNNVDPIYQKMMKKWLVKDVTLTGILNVLDGLLEINGAVVILTTNHISKLDPALIRPGRITMKLEMKKMLAKHANKLVHRHFNKHTKILIQDNIFTPAQLTAYCQEASDIDELSDMIEQHQKI